MRQVRRQDIESTAEAWVGTPFLHQGRSRYLTDTRCGGCDCIGLIIGVSKDLSLISALGKPIAFYDDATYSPMPSGNRLHNLLSSHMIEKSPQEADIGDVLLFKFVKYPQHVAFFTSQDSIIHSHAPYGVRREILNDKWKKRLVGCFRFTEVI